MVRKVEVQLFDDIDGSVAEETVKFGLDGVYYETDLSSANADKLRASLAKFILSARRIARGGVAASSRARAGGGPSRADREQNQAIREWAKRKKVELSDRGRIPRAIIEQFQADAGRPASGRSSRKA